MKTWLIEPLARALIALLWSAGDWLFDWFVTVARAQEWRAAAERKIQLGIDKNDFWTPTTAYGKTWKENRRQMLRAESAYLGVSNSVYRVPDQWQGPAADRAKP